jgi:hypothetical protein
MKNNMTTKETLIGIGIIFAFVLAGWMWLSIPVEASEEYKPLTPQAQTAYDSAYKTLCESEKALAGAKLMDIANGVKMEADLNALNVKRGKNCDF